MSKLILTGSGTTGTITVAQGLGALIDSVEFVLPNNFGTTADISVTLSGLIDGAKVYHNNANPGYRFNLGENVNISTSNLSSGCSVIVTYRYVGNQLPYMEANGVIPIASSLRPMLGA